MSDDTGRILAAIEQLRAEMATRDHLTRMRTDLMARMDRLQARMDSLDEHLTLGLGHADDAMRQARSAADGSHIHAEQIRSLEKLVLKLEARVAQLEDKRQ